MFSNSDIDTRVQFLPANQSKLTLPEVKASTVADLRVDLLDQLGARKFYPGDTFVLAALLDSNRYALVIDTHRTGPQLTWSDAVYLVATSDLRPL